MYIKIKENIEDLSIEELKELNKNLEEKLKMKEENLKELKKIDGIISLLIFILKKLNK